jgi:hypothetical protein
MHKDGGKRWFLPKETGLFDHCSVKYNAKASLSTLPHKLENNDSLESKECSPILDPLPQPSATTSIHLNAPPEGAKTAKCSPLPANLVDLYRGD